MALSIATRGFGSYSGASVNKAATRGFSSGSATSTISGIPTCYAAGVYLPGDQRAGVYLPGAKAATIS
jgi:hypothetical protein